MTKYYVIMKYIIEDCYDIGRNSDILLKKMQKYYELYDISYKIWISKAQGTI
jgi:hypothetical protein